MPAQLYSSLSIKSFRKREFNSTALECEYFFGAFICPINGLQIVPVYFGALLQITELIYRDTKLLSGFSGASKR